MRWALVAAAIALSATGGQAQIAERVRTADDGTVRFSYRLRPGVEICDHGIRMDDQKASWVGEGWDRGPTGCRSDVAEIELSVRGGRVRTLDVVHDRSERARDAEDLGEVTGAEAADYLLSLAYEDASRDAAKEAVLPALIADAPETWRRVMDLARDRSAASSIRKNALFWLGQEGAAASTVGLADVALDDDEEQDVRDAAIFALSQRPAEESVPMLIDVVRSTDNGETRRKAMFWLAQSDDARVVDFFEEVLLGRVR